MCVCVYRTLSYTGVTDHYNFITALIIEHSINISLFVIEVLTCNLQTINEYSLDLLGCHN